MPVTIPSDLLDSYANQRVHLFVGSGVSASVGVIGWEDLIEEMKNVIRNENSTFPPGELNIFLSSADYLDVGDVFRTTVGEHRYIQFLRQHFRSNRGLSRLHRAISRLQVKTMITTNYDKLLEAAVRETTGVEPVAIVFPNQLGFIDNNEVRIIKLHGDIDHPTTIVLTRADYATYARRHLEFEREFHRSVNDFTMLFVGFGIRDKNFRRIYEDARQFYDSGKRLAYALMVGTNAVERSVWDSAGLRIIPFSRYSQIPTFLTHLTSSCSGSSS